MSPHSKLGRHQPPRVRFEVPVKMPNARFLLPLRHGVGKRFPKRITSIELLNRNQTAIPSPSPPQKEERAGVRWFSGYRGCHTCFQFITQSHADRRNAEHLLGKWREAVTYA